MWNTIIRWSLDNRVAVLVLAGMLVAWGVMSARQMAVDVLPDINAPTVTILTEAHGMAPDEVESLVTLPLETAINGSPGLRRLRSSSGIGISVVWAEFDWDTDPMRARQVVAERLQTAAATLPADLDPPMMAPMSSIMGEVLFLGLLADEGVDPMTLRETAEWQVRRRLLGVSGVAQVMPIGGELKQVQVVLEPESMRTLGVGHQQVLAALEGVSSNAPGGFLVSGQTEYLVRGIGRAATIDELGEVLVATTASGPVRLRQVASVRPGAALARGTAAVDGEPAVVLAVQKQPEANTLALTARINEVLDSLEPALPEGVRLHREGYHQAWFIDIALSNVQRHIVESAILVVLLLTVFLMNWRTTLISLVALPLSLLAGLAVLHATGQTLNTMTLGGFAIAIGALVDDAIIDVENVYRRLRQRAGLPPDERPSVLDTVFAASVEIRSSIVYATAVIVLVFLPLFFLSGLEGRLMAPLGLAYVASLIASLLVAVTVTPVLCSLLLGDVPAPDARPDSWLVRHLKAAYTPLLDMALARPRRVMGAAAVGVLLAVVLLSSFGRSFLPRFNEGSYTISAATAPGTPLGTSDAMVHRLEERLLELGFVTSVVRRTGRAELDEHAQDVQYSEMEITVEAEHIERIEVERALREACAVPGLVVSVGQPLGHRIEHMLSGVKTSIAVKVFGDDLPTMRGIAAKVAGAMAGVDGIVDLAVEPQTDVPQVIVRPRYATLAELGLTPGALSEFVETAFLGHTVGQWWEQQRSWDLVVRYPERFRSDPDALASTPIDADGTRFVPLEQVARVERTLGPNLINRENVQRRLVIMANVEDRDIRGVIGDVQAAVAGLGDLPDGYHVEYGGEFESEARASRTIVSLSVLAIFAMGGLLWMALGSGRDALLVLVNLPLALVGGALAVLGMGGVLTVATMVGFITLFGIATRNGILLVTHYRHLVEQEGAGALEAIRRGSMERLVPVLMTAVGTGLALVPIALALDEPGNEIQAPMALVILGGLVTSTALNMLVVPALYRLFGRYRAHAVVTAVSEL